MRGVKGTGFVARCADCGTVLRGVHANRVLRNSVRRCMKCYRAQLKGYSINEGYIRLSNRQYEHRVVASQKLGRPLTKRERVHHVNELQTDNRPDNLKVCASPGWHVWGEGHVSRRA